MRANRRGTGAIRRGLRSENRRGHHVGARAWHARHVGHGARRLVPPAAPSTVSTRGLKRNWITRAEQFGALLLFAPTGAAYGPALLRPPSPTFRHTERRMPPCRRHAPDAGKSTLYATA